MVTVADADAGGDGDGADPACGSSWQRLMTRVESHMVASTSTARGPRDPPLGPDIPLS